MRVRLLKPWKYQKVGKIIADMPDGMANVLIRRKIIEAAPEPKPEPQEKPKRVRT